MRGDTDIAPAAHEDWPPASFMARLSPGDQAGLRSAGTARVYAPGEAIIVGGDERETSAFLILDGYVKVTGVTEDGVETLLAIRARGDVVGELAMLDGGPRTAWVTAVRRTTVREISRDAFSTLMSTSPAIGTALLQVGVAKLREAIQYRIDIGGPSRVRVARVLDTFVRAHGVPDVEGTRIGVPVSQVDLAELASLSSASVQRALKFLREKKAISTTYRGIVVHRLDDLRSIADERE